MRLRLIGCVLAAMLSGQAPAMTYYQWAQGQPIVDMGDPNTQFCFLQSVQGRFSGNGEYVGVGKGMQHWALYGGQGQNGVAASARCMQRSEFGKPGDQRSLSSEQRIEYAYNHDSDCIGPKKSLNFGNAWTAISRIGGRLRGGGEYVEIKQSDSVKFRSTIEVHSCQDHPQMLGGATSFFVGPAGSTKRASFYGPPNILAPANSSYAGEFAAGPNQTVPMAPISSSLCYFTAIGGNFQGGAERVEILTGTDNLKRPIWVLRTRSSSNGGVLARARCLSLKNT